MRTFFEHPVTLVAFAFILLISAWSIIVVTALRHRAETIPVKIEAPAKNG
jgi:hypothetical protein